MKVDIWGQTRLISYVESDPIKSSLVKPSLRMISFIGPLLFFYPIWGGICLFFLCRKLGGKGTLSQRVIWGLMVAAVSTVLFTPVMYGTEGFGIFAPWMIVLFDSKHAGFWWPLSAFVFVVAFIINMMNGEAGPD